jgi:hypothetical protein
MLHLAATTAHINCAYSQLFGLQVVLDIYTTFHGYSLPFLNTNNAVFT